MTHSLIIHRKLEENFLHEGDLEIILCFRIFFQTNEKGFFKGKKKHFENNYHLEGRNSYHANSSAWWWSVAESHWSRGVFAPCPNGLLYFYTPITNFFSDKLIIVPI